MKKSRMINYSIFIFLMILTVQFSCTEITSQSESSDLKDEQSSLKLALGDKFYIGTALNTEQILGNDTTSVKIIKKHFNSIVAENCMKSESIQPNEGEFDFSLPDKFVEFGEKNDMFIIGHTLIWHSQAPKWFFVDNDGNDVSREVMIERMKNHISTLVGRYKGRVNGWDVVNEAINDDGSYRKSKFYEIIGEDYIKLAFQFAKEADPEAELYYNDYSMHLEGKRQGVVKMVNNLQNQGVKVDGIGMQAHSDLVYPTIKEFEESIIAFSGTGVNVMITELDISVLPMPGFNIGADVAKSVEFKKEFDPYTESIPDSVTAIFNKRFSDFFKLFTKHQDKISRITLWGVNDKQSWKNNWPVRGRTDYPLLFDRENNPKEILKTIIKEATTKE